MHLFVRLVVGGDFLLVLGAVRGAGSAWILQHLCSQLVEVIHDMGRREVSISLMAGQILKNLLGTHVEARAKHLL